MNNLEQLIKEQGRCGSCSAPLGSCTHLNILQVNIQVTWLYPTHGNILTGESQKGVAFLCDQCYGTGFGKVIAVHHVVEIDNDRLIQHPIAVVDHEFVLVDEDTVPDAH